MISQKIDTDKMGAALSLLCLFHCLGTALFIGLIPALTVAEDLHAWLLLPLLPLAFIAIYEAVCIHKRMIVAIAMCAGITLITASTVIHHGAVLEYPGMITGSILLATGHFMNHRYCRKCRLPAGDYN